MQPPVIHIYSHNPRSREKLRLPRISNPDRMFPSTIQLKSESTIGLKKRDNSGHKIQRKSSIQKKEGYPVINVLHRRSQTEPIDASKISPNLKKKYLEKVKEIVFRKNNPFDDQSDADSIDISLLKQRIINPPKKIKSAPKLRLSTLLNCDNFLLGLLLVCLILWPLVLAIRLRISKWLKPPESQFEKFTNYFCKIFTDAIDGLVDVIAIE